MTKRKIADYVSFYYRFLGNRIYLLLGLVIVAIIFEGLGLAIFLPVLQPHEPDSAIQQKIVALLGFFGIPNRFEVLLVLLVTFFFCRSAFMILEETYLGRVMNRFLIQLRELFLEKFFQSRYETFVLRPTGSLLNSLVGETDRVVASFLFFAHTVANLLFVFLYLAIPLSVYPKLFSLILLGVIPLALFAKKVNALTRINSVKMTQINQGIHKSILLCVQHFKYWKATHTYPQATRKLISEHQKFGETKNKELTLLAISQYAYEPFVVLLIVLVIVHYHRDGTSGNVIENLYLLAILAQGLQKASNIQVSIRKWISTWGSIDLLIDLEADLNRSAESTARRQISFDFQSPIRLENVSFQYPGQKPIFENINLTISPKACVAFVGSSGSGKTTLANLVMSLLHPSSGQIFYGPHDSSEVDLKMLRRRLGYITQEGMIFNGTLRDNVTLWDQSQATQMTRLDQISQRAHLAPFVSTLPEKWETPMGDQGLNISGGQRQRISIARELYKDVDLLTFDEATSALDSETEREVQRSIDEFRGKKTIILIAHRLSTIKNCDLIYVLSGGKLVAQGTFQELKENDAIFKEMVARQALI